MELGAIKCSIRVEYDLIDKLIYKCKNQHRRCNYFKFLTQIKKITREFLLLMCYSNTLHLEKEEIPKYLQIIRNRIKEILIIIEKAGLSVIYQIKMHFFLPFCISLFLIFSRLYYLFQAFDHIAQNNPNNFFNFINSFKPKIGI